MLTEGKDVIVNNHSLSDEGASPFDSIAGRARQRAFRTAFGGGRSGWLIDDRRCDSMMSPVAFSKG